MCPLSITAPNTLHGGSPHAGSVSVLRGLPRVPMEGPGETLVSFPLAGGGAGGGEGKARHEAPGQSRTTISPPCPMEPSLRAGHPPCPAHLEPEPPVLAPFIPNKHSLPRKHGSVFVGGIKPMVWGAKGAGPFLSCHCPGLHFRE